MTEKRALLNLHHSRFKDIEPDYPRLTKMPGKDGPRLATTAYNAIFVMIMSRQLLAGEIVQERKLAVALGMSRTPVREALHRLEAEGWLTRKNDRTLIVRNVSLEEYMSALQIREMLEPHAAAMAAKNIDPGTVRGLRAELDELRRAGKTEPRRLVEFDEALHMGIALATGNVVLPIVLDRLRKVTQIFENEVMPANPGPGFEEHAAIIDALAKGDDKSASDAMHSHLNILRTKILALVSRLPGSSALPE